MAAFCFSRSSLRSLASLCLSSVLRVEPSITGLVAVFMFIEVWTAIGLTPLWLLLSSAMAWAAATICSRSPFKEEEEEEEEQEGGGTPPPPSAIFSAAGTRNSAGRAEGGRGSAVRTLRTARQRRRGGGQGRPAGRGGPRRLHGAVHSPSPLTGARWRRAGLSPRPGAMGERRALSARGNGRRSPTSRVEMAAPLRREMAGRGGDRAPQRLQAWSRY